MRDIHKNPHRRRCHVIIIWPRAAIWPSNFCNAAPAMRNHRCTHRFWRALMKRATRKRAWWCFVNSARNPSALFSTDKRSAKIAEIEQNPTISLLFYDPKPRIQMRVTGQAFLLPQAIQNRQWQNSMTTQPSLFIQIEPARDTSSPNLHRPAINPTQPIREKIISALLASLCTVWNGFISPLLVIGVPNSFF